MRPIHLAVGKFNIDIIVKLNAFPLVDSKVNTDVMEIMPGGSATNYSVAVNRLGHSAKLLAKIGKSPLVSALLTPLAEEGVGLDFLIECEKKPNMALILLRDDGSISIVRRTDPSLLPSLDDVRKYSGMFDVIHYASISHDVIYKDPSAKIVSYDPGPYASEYEGEEVDILYVNEKEYESLRTKANAKIVVIKKGKEGAELIGSEECKVEALKVNVVDTTGAGDVFDAAFNVSYINTGSIEDSLRFASVAAGLKVTKLGGVSSPKLEEVIKMLKDVNINVKCR
ncbi:carbohydrate kinase family protein [Acidianus ambivalens]|uniref:Carbohydrate kinase family protein n=1 Tax=Acidianus ambivalens TaxID=2283 RepID=A0A650CUX0_ACIAM|nr:carbohydrate kinase family protein [Acidianus ambivalens]MQL55804.1 carbohydrate kinase family protein [Acidianus ambivalens]QGR21626.1 carbohydrate kinase family protein [Acidianus ambivalens]